MIGQFRSTDALVPDLRERWPENRDFAEPEEADQLLPYYPEPVIVHILALFAMLLDYIASKELITVRGNLVLSRVMSYVERNVQKRQVRLEEVCRYAGRSASTISHLCRKHLGSSFKHLLIDAKLRKAEEYFRTEPRITIGEVSERLGFVDQFYFCRIYKKYRKMSPSAYIRRHNFGRGMETTNH